RNSTSERAPKLIACEEPAREHGRVSSNDSQKRKVPSLTVGLLTQSKSPNHLCLGDDGSGFKPIDVFRSTDKHLFVSIGGVNGRWGGGYQHLQAALNTRENRGQLTRRLNYFRLEKF